MRQTRVKGTRSHKGKLFHRSWSYVLFLYPNSSKFNADSKHIQQHFIWFTSNFFPCACRQECNQLFPAGVGYVVLCLVRLTMYRSPCKVLWHPDQFLSFPFNSIQLISPCFLLTQPTTNYFIKSIFDAKDLLTNIQSLFIHFIAQIYVNYLQYVTSSPILTLSDMLGKIATDTAH